MKPPPEELACRYVLDRLTAAERAAAETRLSQDPAFAAQVRDYETALARHIGALPQHAAPSGLFTRIESRLDQPSPADAETTATGRPGARSWAAIAGWGIAALCALSLGTIAVELLRRGPAVDSRPYIILVGLDSRQSTPTRLALSDNPPDADARFIQLASLAENFWEKPADLPFRPRSPAPEGRGYALFNPVSHEGFIAIQHLPAIEAGKCYQLWLVDSVSGEARDAGVLPLTGGSRGLYFFSVDPTEATLPEQLSFFVTTEESGPAKATHPRGKVVLGDRGI